MTTTTRPAVVITGVGALTPAGGSARELWKVIRSGASVAQEATCFDPDGLPVRIACEVPRSVRGAADAARAFATHNYSQWTVRAAEEALADAGLAQSDPTRSAVIVGAAGGGIFDARREVFDSERSSLATGMIHAASAALVAATGWQGPALTIASACASGAQAIGEAVRLLQRGEVDVALAGGADATVSRYVLERFAKLKALSSRNESPTTACRPFDRARDGCLVGEGAAFCVLERLSDAQARRAVPYAAVAGYSRNTDAFHMVMPPPDGRGAVACMRDALNDAGVTPTDVAWINAHGTGTRQNDAAEARAIATVFGATPPPVTSVKGTIGHLMGAAGAVEAIVSCLAMRSSAITPTANFEEPDPDFGVELDVVRGLRAAPRECAVVSNSFAFGGQNASLVFRTL